MVKHDDSDYDNYMDYLRTDEYDYDNYMDYCKKHGVKPMNFDNFKQYQAAISKEGF